MILVKGSKVVFYTLKAFLLSLELEYTLSESGAKVTGGGVLSASFCKSIVFDFGLTAYLSLNFYPISAGTHLKVLNFDLKIGNSSITDYSSSSSCYYFFSFSYF